MIKPNYIIRTNRRTLSLTISKQGELIVKAPKKLPLEYIFSFIEQKQKWITSKQNEIVNITTKNNDLYEYNKFMFLGKLYKCLEVGKVKQIEIINDEIVFPQNISLDKKITLAIKWYKDVSKEIIVSRIDYFANLMQVNYDTVTLTNAKNKWGSCDTHGNIKINLRVAMLPHKLIDYIIIHELTHLVEFNHSKNFYKIIESIMPDYKKYILQLKSCNFLLQLLR